jgi:hypothetical protein
MSRSITKIGVYAGLAVSWATATASFAASEPIEQFLRDESGLAKGRIVSEPATHTAEALLAREKQLLNAPEPDSRVLQWELFQIMLGICTDSFQSPLALQSCIESSLDSYLDLVNVQNQCAAGLPKGRFGKVLRVGTLPRLDAAQAVGEKTSGLIGTIAMGSALSLDAGFSKGSKPSYDLSQVPSVRQAALIAVYPTMDGLAFDLIDTDLQASNGVRFNFVLDAETFVSAKNIILIALYVDGSGTPVFVEAGQVLIEANALPTDWNRDGVRDARDTADYLKHFAASHARADKNGDGHINALDLDLFRSLLSAQP